MSSWRSSAGPWSSTCAALSLDTFGICLAPLVDLTRGRLGPGGLGVMRRLTHLWRRPAISGRPAAGRSGHGAGEALLLGEEAMLHGEQARGRPGRSVDLRVDVLDVVGNGLGRNHQALADLLVRQPPREQSENLDLPGCQP